MCRISCGTSSPMRESPSDEACIPQNRPVMPRIRDILQLFNNSGRNEQ